MHTVVGLLLLSLCVPLVISGGSFVPLAVAGVAILVFGILLAPDLFIFLAPIPFILAGMPPLDPGAIFQTVRWVFLLLLGISLIVRGGFAAFRRVQHPIYLSLAFFTLLCFVSTGYSSSPSMTLLKSLSFGALLLFAVACGALLLSQGAARVCSYFGLLTLLVIAGTGVAAMRGGLTGPWGDFEGLFGNPNFLGAFLGITFPFLLFGLERRVQPSPLRRLVTGLFLVAGVVFLLSSHSRAGIGAAILGVGWWLFFSKRRAFAIFLVGITLATLVGLQFYPSFFRGVEQQYVYKWHEPVIDSRVNLWNTDTEVFEKRPFFGEGFGISQGLSHGWQLSSQTGKWGREKGNSYLAIAGEDGVVGFLLLLIPVAWVLVRTAQWLIRCRRKNEMGAEFWTALALSACLVAGLTDAFAEAWLTAAGFFGTVIFWIAFGMLAAQMTRRLPQGG